MKSFHTAVLHHFNDHKTAIQVRKVAGVAINVMLRNRGRARRAIVSMTKRK